MKTRTAILSILSFLLFAACSSQTGAGSTPSERIPTGPEPGSPAARTQRDSAASPNAGMPGAY